MNAGITVVPILLIRYALMAMVNRQALPRAAYFAPLQGMEKASYILYQCTGLGSIAYLFFVRINTDGPWLFIGLGLYLSGILLYAIAVVHFSSPDKSGFSVRGLYKFSRNPMYVAYFLCFLGCAALTQSQLLLLSVLVFQASAHGIILSEERWCEAQFGQAYREYKRRVRRYV